MKVPESLHEHTMIPIRDIDHLVLRIVDLDNMLRFYVGALGCTIERRDDAIGLVQLRAGRSLIDLVPVSGKLGRAGGAAPGAEARNMDHFCLRVEPFDEADIRRTLAAHGIEAGALASRYGAEGEGPSLYISDPEGNVVELKGRPDAAPSQTEPARAAGPEAVVQRQLEAYNAHDLARFVAQYSDDIRVYRLPAFEPVLVGKPAFAEFFATQRFNRTEMHAEVVKRIVLGNKVIDHERVSGLQAAPIEVAVVYEVIEGLIRRTWMHAAS